MVAPSASALADVLKENGADGSAIRKRVHRTALWAYCTGRRMPNAKTAALLHRVTRGRVAANGWVLDSEVA